MNFIEYIYCYTIRQYQKWGENDVPSIYALAFITLLQFFNFVTVFLVLVLFKTLDVLSVSKLFVAILCLLLLVLNAFYFLKFKGKTHLFKQFEELQKEGKKGVRNVALLYVIGTFIFFLIVFTIYMRS